MLEEILELNKEWIKYQTDKLYQRLAEENKEYAERLQIKL